MAWDEAVPQRKESPTRKRAIIRRKTIAVRAHVSHHAYSIGDHRPLKIEGYSF
jgi:hypothetical protein